MNIEKCDVVIAGVGGQGILLSSDVLGAACIAEGIPVKGAEVHGMAQRGGSVEAHIRIGCIYGPKIPENGADILIAMEPLEGARYSPYLKTNGIAIVNTEQIPLLGQNYKTADMLNVIKEKTENLIMHDFTAEALKAGSVKVLNILMLGAVSKYIPLGKDSLIEAIRNTVKEKFWDMNLAAFNAGTDTF